MLQLSYIAIIIVLNSGPAVYFFRATPPKPSDLGEKFLQRNKLVGLKNFTQVTIWEQATIIMVATFIY